MKRTSRKAKRKEPLRGVALEDEAVRLRLHEGKRFSVIARKLGMKNAAAAQRAVDRGAKRLPRNEADLYRRMTTERLEHLYEMAHNKAMRGDATQIKTAASIAGQQAKLNEADGSQVSEAPSESAPIPITIAREAIEAFEKDGGRIDDPEQARVASTLLTLSSSPLGSLKKISGRCSSRSCRPSRHVLEPR